MNVFIVGASRGIGLEFVTQYRAAGDAVIATARDDAGLERLHALGATALRLDVADVASASGLAWALDGAALDVAIVNAGVTGERGPGLATPTGDDFDHVMRTNVLGPMRVVPQIVESLAPGGRIVVLSSRMGSIANRTAAGSSLYRASKAALNSVLKDASIAYGDRAICVAVTPGWVRTDMGGASADLEVGTSVAGLRRVIAGLATGDNGSFLSHDGQKVSW
jgi:NAD(P)-dependent dehydrogenase (short-subunit alcohol dehydrogenase family)